MDVKNKIDKLNIFRIVAFLCVFVLHAKIFIPVEWNKGIDWAWILYTPAWAGVWMFIFIAGYGIGAGFFSNKYALSVNGIYKYYLSRLKGIVPIYWFYIFLVAIFVYPEMLLPRFVNVRKFIALLFFNYQEEFDSLQYGLSWYLTTLLRLYFLAPFIFWTIKRWVKSRKQTDILIAITIVLGLLSRVAMGYHISRTGENWSTSIYKPFYFNLDIFCVGFLLNKYKEYNVVIRHSLIKKSVSVLMLVVLIVANSYIYYHGNYSANEDYMNIYCYICPTLYIIVSMAYVYYFEIGKNYMQSKLSFAGIIKNPLRIIDFFRNIQMPMYLFHSTVLLCLQNAYDDERYTKYAQILGANKINIEFVKGLLFTVQGLLVTVFWSIIVYLIFSKRTTNNVFDKIYYFDVDKIATKIKKLLVKVLSTLFPVNSKKQDNQSF